MARAQMISMDFIMAFIIYMSALSIFFFSYQSTLSTAQFRLDPSSVFSKLTNMDSSFLKGAKIVGIDDYLSDYDPSKLNEILKDTQSADYCLYISNQSGAIFRNFAATEGENSIFFGGTECGANKNHRYYFPPACKLSEGLIVSKPVIFDRRVMELNVLACSK